MPSWLIVDVSLNDLIKTFIYASINALALVMVGHMWNRTLENSKRKKAKGDKDDNNGET